MTTHRKLVVQGRGPEGRVSFYLEAYHGKIWITSFDSPFTLEAIFEPTQTDSLVDLIKVSAEKARGHKESTES